MGIPPWLRFPSQHQELPVHQESQELTSWQGSSSQRPEMVPREAGQDPKRPSDATESESGEPSSSTWKGKESTTREVKEASEIFHSDDIKQIKQEISDILSTRYYVQCLYEKKIIFSIIDKFMRDPYMK